MTTKPTAEQAVPKLGRPRKPASEKMVPVTLRMTPAQRDKLAAMGGTRAVRDWIDKRR